jgi:putative flavoprotein involved in K+ transport
MNGRRETQRIETVIIGGGQAGLSTAYHLKRRGRAVTILDAHARVGDSWRTRWDSLRLFTPAKYDGLPGWRFPGPRWSFPAKDELADYFEAYAARFELPVQTGVRVDRLGKERGRFVVESEQLRVEADHVVVATGAHKTPRVPPFASELGDGILQLHSSEYLRPAQLAAGPTLVVGAPTSRCR